MLYQHSDNWPKTRRQALFDHSGRRPVVVGPLLDDEGLAALVGFAFSSKATRINAGSPGSAVVVECNAHSFRRGHHSRVLTRDLVPATASSLGRARPEVYIIHNCHPFKRMFFISAT